MERATATPEMLRIARGTAWSAAGIVVTQTLGVVAMLVSARALPPEAFGVAGMASVVTALLGAFRDLGLGPAIASGRVSDERTLAAAHWLLCAVSLLLWLAVVAAAPLVAAFYGSEPLRDVLRVQAAGVVFGSAVAVPQALLQRSGRFALLAVLAGVTQALATGGAVVAVTLGAGVWTLVVPGVASAALVVPAYWLALGRRLPLVAGGAGLRGLVAEGLRLSAAAPFSYVIRNADKAILGRLAGEQALGHYAFAYTFLVQPLGLFSHAFAPVLLPALGRLSGRELRSDGVVRVTLTLLRVGAPFLVGGALVAPLFVPLLFGPQWAPAVPLVQVLMVVGALQIPGPVFGTLCLAIGDAPFVLRWTAACGVAAVPVFLAGALAGGAAGVTWAYLGYTVVQVSAMRWVARRRFDLPLSGLVRGLLAVARDLALLAAAVVPARLAAAAAGLSPWSQLGVAVGAGAAAYVLAVRLLAAREAAQLLALLPPWLGRPGARLLRLTAP